MGLVSSTFFRGLYLYDRKRLNYSCAAAGRAFIFLFDPLVILRQRPNLGEGFVALLTMKFVRRHVFSSCSSPFDPDAIYHPLDPEHVPGVAFGHLFHGLIENQPIERDGPVLACDPDFGRIDKRSFSNVSRTASVSSPSRRSPIFVRIKWTIRVRKMRSTRLKISVSFAINVSAGRTSNPLFQFLRKACAISNGPRVLSNCLCPQVFRGDGFCGA